jgi:hypothetical protein
MSPDDFRCLALALPGITASSHMRHPDFRVGKRVLATLGYPDDDWAMIQLSPEQQALLVATQPKIFSPVKGTWGVRGSTHVKLAAADEPSVSNALRLAWQRLSERSKAAPSRRKDPSALNKTGQRSRSAPTKTQKGSR